MSEIQRKPLSVIESAAGVGHEATANPGGVAVAASGGRDAGVVSGTGPDEASVQGSSALPATTPRGGDLLDVLAAWARDRRSGTLTLRDGGPLGALVITEGRLVQVRRAQAGEPLGALLVRAGVLQSEEVHGAEAGPAGETLEQLIARVERRRGVDHLLVRVDDVVAEAMLELALLVIAHGGGSGSFRRAPTQVPEAAVPAAAGVGPRTSSGARAAPRLPEPSAPGIVRRIGDDALTLPSGIDLEEVVEEARARGFAFPLVRFDEDSDGRSAPTLTIVDDDPAFLAAVASALGHAGVSASLVNNARQGRERLAELRPDDVVLVDLFLPRSNGRGFLGGLELARFAAETGVADQIFVALDGSHDDAEGELRALGAAGCLRRPPVDDPTALRGFLAPLLARLRAGEVGVQVAVNLVDELRGELGERDWKPPGAGRDAVDDDATSLTRLKALLAELNAPDFDEEIPLLILRFASVFFPRAALFRVDHGAGEFVGLGGFGVAAPDPGRRIRSLRLAATAPSVLADAVEARCGIRHSFSITAADATLAEGLGIAPGSALYVAPLFSPQGLEGVLIADNGSTERPFPNLALLEIFLQQAAAAMDRASLARQVRWLQTQPPTTVPPTFAVADAPDRAERTR